jgi:hypothetical protein
MNRDVILLAGRVALGVIFVTGRFALDAMLGGRRKPA